MTHSKTPITLDKAFHHFMTINHHRYLVMKGCFAVGLYRQGLLHDLSKYSPTEFLVGARYYQGFRSPNNAEREEKGYSSSWLHHKGRNKHHFEYWIDFNPRAEHGESLLMPAKMPGRYVAEMLMDRIAASKVYHADTYTDAAPREYYRSGRSNEFIHPQTRVLLEKLLDMLAEEGEEATFAYVRSHLHKKPLFEKQDLQKKLFQNRLLQKETHHPHPAKADKTKGGKTVCWSGPLFQVQVSVRRDRPT